MHKFSSILRLYFLLNRGSSSIVSFFSRISEWRSTSSRTARHCAVGRSHSMRETTCWVAFDRWTHISSCMPWYISWHKTHLLRSLASLKQMSSLWGISLTWPGVTAFTDSVACNLPLPGFPQSIQYGSLIWYLPQDRDPTSMLQLGPPLSTCQQWSRWLKIVHVLCVADIKFLKMGGKQNTESLMMTSKLPWNDNMLPVTAKSRLSYQYLSHIYS